jgi:hypothetical protein
VEHEGIRIGSEFGDDERDALRHQAGEKRDVTRETIKLGDYDRTLCPLIRRKENFSHRGRRVMASTQPDHVQWSSTVRSFWLTAPCGVADRISQPAAI